MTDNMIPADKVEEIIDSMNADLKTPASDEAWGDGYDRATAAYKERLEALLPKPRTLADELREYAENILAVESASDVKRQLILFADRVKTLEEANLDMECKVKNHEQYAEEMESELAVTQDKRDNLELQVDEQASEIEWLRPHELPDGWRLADHPEYGRVMATNATPGYEGHVRFMHPNFAKTAGYDLHYCNPADLTFLDTNQ